MKNKTARLMDGVLQHLESLRDDGADTVILDAKPVFPAAKASPARPKATPAVRPPAPVPAPAALKSAPPPASKPAGERPADPEAALAAIAARISVCTLCPLHATRTKTVPGQGNPRTEILFIGEGPGREEDAQGLAFVGRAGELLTRMITGMGLTRAEVFIGNIAKCRPTVDYAKIKDRPPTPEEMAACLPYLREQIAALQPRVIVTLGNTALEGLFGVRGITKLRGQWREFEHIPTLPTYHPSFLLRNGESSSGYYWEVWDDLLAVLKYLGKPLPAKKRKEKGPDAGTAGS